MKDYFSNMAVEWLWWVLSEIVGGLGVSGVVALIAGGVLLLSMSAGAMRFFSSPRGMAATAAVMIAGLVFLWWGWGKASPSAVPVASAARPVSQPRPLPASEPEPAEPEAEPEPDPIEAEAEPGPAAKPARRKQTPPPVPVLTIFADAQPVLPPPLPTVTNFHSPSAQASLIQRPPPFPATAQTHKAAMTHSTLSPMSMTLPLGNDAGRQSGGGNQVTADAHRRAAHANRAASTFQPSGVFGQGRAGNAGPSMGGAANPMTPAQQGRHLRSPQHSGSGQMTGQMFGPWTAGPNAGMGMPPMGGGHPPGNFHGGGMGHGAGHMPAGGMGHGGANLPGGGNMPGGGIGHPGGHMPVGGMSHSGGLR